MKVCPLTRISSPAPEIFPQCSPYRDCLLHGKSIPVLPALERYSKDPGSSPGGEACFSHQ